MSVPSTSVRFLSSVLHGRGTFVSEIPAIFCVRSVFSFNLFPDYATLRPVHGPFLSVLFASAIVKLVLLNVTNASAPPVGHDTPIVPVALGTASVYSGRRCEQQN